MVIQGRGQLSNEPGGGAAWPDHASAVPGMMAGAGRGRTLKIGTAGSACGSEQVSRLSRQW
jgi:hypothetical protein